jgi:hypothetical protein
LPLRADEVDAGLQFESSELLYRRVSKNGVNSLGELLPSELNTFSFDKDLDSAPSVLRSAFSKPVDALALDCANGKDVSDWRVFWIAVADLPTPLAAPDGRSFEFYPVHRPLPQCGAHSVIASCTAGDTARTYKAPPRSVRNDLRTKLAVRLKPVEV